MTEPPFQLATCPIVEAVIEMRCDLPPAFDLAALEETAREAFRSPYGKFQKQILQTHRFEMQGEEPPKVSAGQGLQALQFTQEDGRQLVQAMALGFSFNRLAPYTTLDDYLPEVERTWKLFASLAAPVLVREIRLRYINRLLLPMVDGKLDFDDYLKVSPHLPDEDRLSFLGFFNQHTAVEVGTGHQVNIILTMQPPEEERIPVIFDIDARAEGTAEPDDWARIESIIAELRGLKNRVFKNTLTDKCLNLYSR